MSRKVTVAAVQAHYGTDMQANIAKTEKLVREAAAKGAQIIMPSELFQNIYFCNSQDSHWFGEAFPADTHPCVVAMQKLAKELKVVIPTSIYERDGQEYYNSIVIIDADGTNMGTYRKTHIPDGTGYMEKYFFRPGNLGFKVWDTKYARIGVGICWDQWYPEVARAMMLKGAEILFYPTAIGAEPHKPELDTSKQWQRAMQGHAVSNIVPVVASNRVGKETNPRIKDAAQATTTYYGHSFITDHTGELVQSFNREADGVLVHTFDLDFLDRHRAEWGFFRDRRTDVYKGIIC